MNDPIRHNGFAPIAMCIATAVVVALLVALAGVSILGLGVLTLGPVQ